MPCRRVSYAQERHLFHVMVTKGITFLCMADEVTGCILPFTRRDASRLWGPDPLHTSGATSGLSASIRRERITSRALAWPAVSGAGEQTAAHHHEDLNSSA